jgi:hypothetical protein
MTLASFMIGATVETMVNIENIVAGETLLPPKLTVQHFDSIVQLASGGARGLGPGIIRWLFPYMTIAQRAAFKTLCSGASANVYIQSPGLADISTYYIYACTMLWPEEEMRDNLRGYRRLEIEFSNLVIVGD